MKKTVIITCTFMAMCMSVSSSQALDKWDVVIAPYALVPSIDGDTSVGRVEGGDIDVGPDDILKSLELGAMIQLEAHHDSGFGAIVAYNFMDLSGSATGPEGQNSLKADVYQGIFEGYGNYRVNTGGGTLDFYGGIRWWDMDVELKANGTKLVENKPDWVDPVVGVRWTPELSENWNLILKGDIGGFGVSSDFTWNLQGGFSWDATDYLTLVLQYRALSVDYTTGEVGSLNRFSYDTITHGPLFGLAFRL